MTPEEFKKAMIKIRKEIHEVPVRGTEVIDLEDSHVESDNLLCKALREAGYGDGIDIYEKMEKWYA